MRGIWYWLRFASFWEKALFCGIGVFVAWQAHWMRTNPYYWNHQGFTPEECGTVVVASDYVDWRSPTGLVPFQPLDSFTVVSGEYRDGYSMARTVPWNERTNLPEYVPINWDSVVKDLMEGSAYCLKEMPSG